jgi:hypothetical protein
MLKLWTADILMIVMEIELPWGGIHQHFQVGHNSVITVMTNLARAKTTISEENS